MQNVRVRFAPSPTGPLHIGGVRTALYNYLFAKKYQGTFLLRIEDTDQSRYVKGAERYIIDTLGWCGMHPDEGPENGGPYGPYRQSQRKTIYQQYIQKLLDRGHAYYAFDTSEELETMRDMGDGHAKYDGTTRMMMRNTFTLGKDKADEMINQGEPYVVRLLVPTAQKISFHDMIRGEVVFDSAELDDKVIMKADGLPTYHLANVVDDYLMKISHVIRGEEWLSSTAHHVLLYDAFGWQDVMPSFAHLPLILKPTGKGKLSKRDGQKFGFPVFPLPWEDDDPSESFAGFKSMGFDPGAMLNFLAFLGWNPGTEQEIFSLPELVEAFSLEQIGKSGARFDYDKALWYNAQYIANQNELEVAQAALPFAHQAGWQVTIDELIPICGLLKDRLKTYAEIPALSTYFYQEVADFDEQIIRKKWSETAKSHYLQLLTLLTSIESFDRLTIKQAVSDFVDQSGMKFGDILPLLRVALSGQSKGPDLFGIAEILGKEKANKRWADAISIFDQMVT